ncbi:hypothetical protein C8E86_3721 [Catellatospora citrea]|nr:hypothetical protein C8E86_3721 [Catellatospora citrea]
MVSAYAVRRLNEARKISDQLRASTWKAREHTLVGRVPDIMHDRFWESYELEQFKTIQMPLTKVLNQIIHSWVFVLSWTEDEKFDGIFVSAENSRQKCLYFIHIDTLIRMFRAVGEDDIVHLEMRRNAEGQLEVTRALSAREAQALPTDAASVRVVNVPSARNG